MSSPVLRRIVVFCLPGIGDAILFTPALTLLRQAYPSAHIAVITMFHGTAEILAANPDLDEVHHFDFFNSSAWASLRYLRQLRRDRYDLSLMCFPSNRFEYNCVNRFVGRRWRAAHRYHRHSWRNGWFLNNIVVRESGAIHNVTENLRLLRAIIARVGSEIPAADLPVDAELTLKIRVPPDDARYADEFLTGHRVARADLLFGFHTYSSTFKNMHRKCWDRQNFADLIAQLHSRYPGARFLLFSGPHDEEVTKFIIARVDGRVIPVRETNLRRAAAIMQRCRLFITNDSGPMHLAAALRVPVVALFGPTDARRLHPWSQVYTVVRRDLPCSPCFQYSPAPLSCPANLDYACMREITQAEVQQAVANLLAQTSPLNTGPGQPIYPTA
ncbi:MAG: Lipopolysaccharide core heptosyltransferase RfaQ [Verrucomicrobiae bacterium]|nr:Lipopolysaccharide core heptosyltransferase RfaQ [Verrucomicrobiae bacterium]